MLSVILHHYDTFVAFLLFSGLKSNLSQTISHCLPHLTFGYLPIAVSLRFDVGESFLCVNFFMWNV